MPVGDARVSERKGREEKRPHPDKCYLVCCAFQYSLFQVRKLAPSWGLKIVVINLLSLSSYCGSIIVTDS